MFELYVITLRDALYNYDQYKPIFYKINILNKRILNELLGTKNKTIKMTNILKGGVQLSDTLKEIDKGKINIKKNIEELGNIVQMKDFRIDEFIKLMLMNKELLTLFMSYIDALYNITKDQNLKELHDSFYYFMQIINSYVLDINQ